MRQIVELVLIAQAGFAVLLLGGAYVGALLCRRHQRRAAQGLRLPVEPRLRGRGAGAAAARDPRSY